MVRDAIFSEAYVDGIYPQYSRGWVCIEEGHLNAAAVKAAWGKVNLLFDEEVCDDI